ncbi:cytidylate kinase-like family protein [Candidatus Beckwithbacteria bacterium]|nr:cytidylate kinase-like family protein [Candidatus Beckwithbacteria bacterium]
MMNYEPLISQNLSYQRVLQSLQQQTFKNKIYPTITISRDPGSGGREIAKLVAQELGVKLYDKKQLTKLVAVKTGVDPKILKKLMDEQIQPPMESIIETFLGLKRVSDQTFIKNLVSVVIEIASKRPAVILGSGINFVLPYMSNFRVRITAPRKVLITCAKKYENKTTRQARETIDKYMRIRHDFVYKFFSKNIAKAHYYDLVVNTNYFSVEDAAAIIVKGFRRKVMRTKKLVKISGK